MCLDPTGRVHIGKSMVWKAGSPCRPVHSEMDASDETEWTVEGSTGQKKTGTDSKKTASRVKQSTLESKEAKKWGGDGHITSPTSSAPWGEPIA